MNILSKTITNTLLTFSIWLCLIGSAVALSDNTPRYAGAIGNCYGYAEVFDNGSNNSARFTQFRVDNNYLQYGRYEATSASAAYNWVSDIRPLFPSVGKMDSSILYNCLTGGGYSAAQATIARNSYQEIGVAANYYSSTGYGISYIASNGVRKYNGFFENIGAPAPTATAVHQTNGTVTVSGKTDRPGSLTVTFKDGQQFNVTTPSDGSYSINSTKPQLDGNITVSFEDLPVKSAVRTVNFDDNIPPATHTPTISYFDDGAIEVLGQIEAYATIKLEFPVGTARTVTTGADGRYNVISDMGQIKDDMTITLTDLAGNSRTRDKEVFPPTAPPVISTIVEKDDGTLTVSGTAKAGAEVKVKFTDGTVLTTTATGGTFSVDSAKPQVNGDIIATAKLPDLDISKDVTKAYTDAKAPAIPIIQSITENADGTLTISIKSEVSSTVAVTFSDTTSANATVTSTPGIYTITSPKYQPSGNVLAKATDLNSNVGPQATQAYVDNIVPDKPTIDTISNNTDGTVKVSGTAEPNSTVKIKFPDGITVSMTATSTGTYSVDSAKPQLNGDVIATATDPKGNVSPEEKKSYQDSTAPGLPVIDPIVNNANGTIKVTGTAEAGSTVTVVFPDGTTADVVAVNGVFTANSAKPQPNGNVTATATDINDNEGATATSPYSDTTKPAVPTGLNIVQKNDGTITVSGNAEANSAVKITFPDSSTTTVNADQNGAFTGDSTTPQPNGDVKATSTDTNNNTSIEAVKAYADTVAPEKPTITSFETTATNPLTVKGKAEVGSTVIVKFPDMSTATGTADSAGNYEISSTSHQASGNVIVTATDVNSNKSAETTKNYVDVTPPAAPVISGITDNAVGIVTVTGTAEPNSTVTVKFPDGTEVSATADATTGAYSINSAQPQPSGTITVATLDPYGNKSPDATSTYTDTSNPADPVISTITDNTNGTLTATGTAEVGSIVSITFPDGTIVTATTASDGSYTVVSAKPQPSGNVTAITRDKSNNASGLVTQAYEDVVKPEDPKITNLTDDADGIVIITGTAEEGAIVIVKFPDGSEMMETADSNRAYSIRSAKPQESGDIAVTATDKNGNKSPETIIAYNDTIAPLTPTINSITNNTDGTIKISGSGEAGSTITVKLPDGTSTTETADDAGGYVINSPTPQPSGDVIATATDQSGNESSQITKPYSDTTAPETPAIDAITDNADGTITVTGRAEVGSVVTVTFPDGTTETVTVGGDGTYEITSATPQPSGNLRVTATDKSGNSSLEVSKIYTDTKEPGIPTNVTVTQNSDGTITISGNAEANASISLTFPDGTVITATVDENGAFAIVSNKPQPNGEFEIITTDVNGNVSEVYKGNNADAIAPAKPEIELTYNENDTLTATLVTESYATVEVIFPDGIVMTGTADANGKYTVTSAAGQPDGMVKTTAIDIAGNRSLTGEYEYKIDAIAPEVEITGVPEGFSLNETFDITVTFSEVVYGFELSDMFVENASASNFAGSGATYTMTITPNYGGNVKIQVPAGVARDLNFNLNNASPVVEVKNMIVDETQEIIAGFMITRANLLIGNQPDLTSFMTGGDGSFSGGGNMENGNLSFNSGYKSPVWLRLQAAWSENGDIKSDYLFGAAGIHYKFTPNILAGIMVQFDHITSEENLSSVEGTGWLVGPYAVMKLPDQPLYFEARLLWGKTNNKISPYGTYVDDFETERLLAQIKLSGDIRFDSLTLTPRLAGTYTTDKQLQYTDSLGNVIPSQSIELGQLDFGIDLSVPVDVETGELIFKAGLSGIYSYTGASGFATTQLPAYSGVHARMDLGIDYKFNEFISLDFNGFFDGIGAEGQATYGLDIGANVKF